jgi:hypothetical protein
MVGKHNNLAINEFNTCVFAIADIVA